MILRKRVRSPDEFEFEYSVQCKLPPVVGLSLRMFVQDDRSRSRSSRLRTQTIPVNIINQISLNDVWRCKCKLKTENGTVESRRMTSKLLLKVVNGLKGGCTIAESFQVEALLGHKLMDTHANFHLANTSTQGEI